MKRILLAAAGLLVAFALLGAAPTPITPPVIT